MLLGPPARWTASAAAAAAAALLPAAARGELLATGAQPVYAAGPQGPRPQHRFYSSNETSPVLQLNTWNASGLAASAAAAHGTHIFLRQSHYDTAHSAPLVLSAADLSTVWVSHAGAHEGVYGTRVQADRGRRYLTFWAGVRDDGYGSSSGVGLAYDAEYRLAYNVTAHNAAGRAADLHEFHFTGHGTVLLLAVEDVPLDLADYPEWRGAHRRLRVRDNIIQEIDLDTNELLFSWRALDHLSPADTFEPSGPYWDLFHTNSLEKTDDGDYLVSMRHTHSIHLIDGRTGAIRWTLGGKRNTFAERPPAPGARASAHGAPVAPLLSMAWQHHARLVPGTAGRELTLFDNHAVDTSQGACRAAGRCSRGLRVALDVPAADADADAAPPTAQILRQYLHPADLRAKNQGSMQVLPASAADDAEHVFIGWGHAPGFTQHDAATGAVLLDVQFAPWPDNTTPAPDNYRAHRMDWAATPWWDPALAVRADAHGDIAVFASWNGATEVREWVVRGRDDGDGDGDGRELARAPRAGFETRLPVGARAWLPRRVWVEALGADGAVLRASEAREVHGAAIRREGDDEDDDEELAVRRGGGAATRSWVLVGVGLGGLALGVVGGYFVAPVVVAAARRRRQSSGAGYDLLDDDVTDVGSELGMEDVWLGLDGWKNNLTPRGWERSGSRSPRRNMPEWRP